MKTLIAIMSKILGVNVYTYIYFYTGNRKEWNNFVEKAKTHPRL
jgi:hypothetical protein